MRSVSRRPGAALLAALVALGAACLPWACGGADSGGPPVLGGGGTGVDSGGQGYDGTLGPDVGADATSETSSADRPVGDVAPDSLDASMSDVPIFMAQDAFWDAPDSSPTHEMDGPGPGDGPSMLGDGPPLRD